MMVWVGLLCFCVSGFFLGVAFALVSDVFCAIGGLFGCSCCWWLGG